MKKQATVMQSFPQYIYHIRAGKYFYVGQSKAKGNFTRLASHIRAAYHHEVDAAFYIRDSEEAIHQQMANYTISDLDIQVYPGPNFGIDNFEVLCEEFWKEWLPYDYIEHSATSKPDYTALTKKYALDLAEIFHIQWALRRYGQNLKNNQMGGNIISLSPVGAEVKNNRLPNINNLTSKIIFKSDPPTTAQTKFKMRVDYALQVNQITQQVYNDLFSSEWTNIYNDLHNRVNIKNKDEAAQTWQEYLHNRLSKVWLDVIPDELYDAMKKAFYGGKGLTTNSKTWFERVEKNVKTRLKFEINKHFLKPKQDLINLYIRETYGIAIDTIWDTISEGWEGFNYLLDYIVKVIRNVTGIWDVRKDDKNRNFINEKFLKEFKPINFSAMYDVKKIGTSRHRGRWLKQINISEFGSIDMTPFKQNRGIWLFNYFFKKVQKETNFKTIISNANNENIVVNTDNGPIYRMDYAIGSDNWLATRMKQWYEKYSPGYCKKWWEYYRPMVSAWRWQQTKAQPFTELQSEATDHIVTYYAWYWKSDKNWIGYRSNHIWENTNVFKTVDDLTIY